MKHRFSPFVFLLFLPCSSLLAGAQPAPRRATLPGGVRLILSPEPTAATVAVSLFVRTGPAATPEEETTAEVTANALLFGSVTRTFEGNSVSVAQAGGAVETLRTPEYVVVTCVTLPEQVLTACYLLTEAFKNADFRPEALARARAAIRAASFPKTVQPMEAAEDNLARALRGTPEPDEAALGRVTPALALSYFRRHYLPSRAVFVVAGRFHARRVQETLTADLGDFIREPASPAPQPPTTNRSTPSLLPPASSLPSLALISADAPGIDSPDYAPFVVLHTLLGEGHGSRLFQNVRSALGIGYRVGAAWAAERAGPLVAYLQWDAASDRTDRPPLTRDAAQNLLATELESVSTRPPSEAELERAKGLAVGRHLARHERLRDRAFLLGWHAVMSLPDDFDATLPDRLRAVTRDDILRVAKRYLPVRSSVPLLPRKPH